MAKSWGSEMLQQGSMLRLKPCSGDNASASSKKWPSGSLGFALWFCDSLSCPSGHNKVFLHLRFVSLPSSPSWGDHGGGSQATVGGQMLVLRCPGQVRVGAVGSLNIQAGWRKACGGSCRSWREGRYLDRFRQCSYACSSPPGSGTSCNRSRCSAEAIQRFQASAQRRLGNREY